eukprot:scaffold312176_cov32-Tisochrysis_lutea.AAC.2
MKRNHGRLGAIRRHLGQLHTVDEVGAGNDGQGARELALGSVLLGGCLLDGGGSEFVLTTDAHAYGGSTGRAKLLRQVLRVVQVVTPERDGGLRRALANERHGALRLLECFVERVLVSGGRRREGASLKPCLESNHRLCRIRAHRREPLFRAELRSGR